MTSYLFPNYAAGDEWDADDLTAARLVTQGTYTPVLSASGGTNVLGASGFLVGWWHRTGLKIWGGFDLNISGAGATLAGTTWRITLPFDADLTLLTAGVLDARSTYIGSARLRSGTAAQSKGASILLSAVAEMIFYNNDGTNTSLGASDFTTSARIHGMFEYVADPAEFP